MATDSEKITDISAIENQVIGEIEESSDAYRQLTRNVLWKFDIHILPSLALIWLANFIDRTNIGNAKIAGLVTDTHLRGNQINTALAVFYITYIISELPSNWVLKKLKPNRWLPFIVAFWGLVTTLSGLVENFAGLAAIRMTLGLCEGGLLPGIVLYLSTIYNRHELQLRVGIFYASASLSGAFGGLLASAILKMDGIGNLAGWRWIFILEGLSTIIIGLIAAVVLPADISSAKFLTDEEKKHALHRFRSATAVTSSAFMSEASRRIAVVNLEKSEVNHTETESIGQNALVIINQEDEVFEWREIVRGCVDVQCWLTGIAYLGLTVSLYSFSLFLPTIVSGLGFSGEAAQLHTVPPYVPAVVLTVVVAFLADRIQWRGPFILICLPLSIIGYIIAIKANTDKERYAAVFLIAAGVYPSGPSILSILPNNSSGHYKKATTTALQLMIANNSGFIATFAYTADQAPHYIRGHTISLAFVCLAWVMILINILYCTHENKARREGRRRINLERYQELWDSGKTRAPIGDRSPDFLFTL